MEVLPFALLLIEANATIELLNECVYIFLRYLSQKALQSIIYREMSNHRRKRM